MSLGSQRRMSGSSGGLMPRQTHRNSALFVSICSLRAPRAAICSLFVSFGTETAQIYAEVPQSFMVFRDRASRFSKDLGGVSIVDNKVCAAPIIPPQATLFAT